MSKRRSLSTKWSTRQRNATEPLLASPRLCAPCLLLARIHRGGSPESKARDGFARPAPLREVFLRTVRCERSARQAVRMRSAHGNRRCRAAAAPYCVAVCLLFSVASGCAPTVGIGSLCSESPGDGAVSPDPDASVTFPWSTGFEEGFCDYAQPMGFCFETGSGSFELVTSPVHSGRFAAAFSVRSNNDGGSQVRCVRQGTFPAAAYYGAWYYVAAPATNTGLWNLFHFQGGVPGQTLHGLWDVSLNSLGDGGLHLALFDFLAGTTPDAGGIPPIPIGRWFHLEVYFKRASDTTGEIAMWQDEQLALRLQNLETDDTSWGQWYVGNLATALAPPDSTVYVDDVTIDSTPPP